MATLILLCAHSGLRYATDFDEKVCCYIGLTYTLIGCSTQHRIDAQEQVFSGYLNHYQQMEPLDNQRGLRWFSGDLSEYRNVILTPVSVFPNPNLQLVEGSARAQAIASYLDDGFRKTSARVGRLAATPGQQTLRVEVAITGVFSEVQDMKPRQYVLPVALARTIIQAVTDRRPAVAVVYLETRIFDSVTGELKGELLRKGIGKQSKNTEITQADVQALLDDWLESYAAGLQRMRP